MSKDLPQFAEILKNELARRVEKNPRYTLRAFARDLSLTAPSLSLILRGKQGLSVPRASQILELIKLSEIETQIFIASVEANHSRSRLHREKAEKSLRSLLNKKNWKIRAKTNDLLFQSWIPLAMFEHLKVFQKGDIRTLAKVFNISYETASQELNKLVDSLLVRKTNHGLFEAEDTKDLFGGEIPSENIRKFHKSVHQKGLEAIDQEKFEDRETSSTFFSTKIDSRVQIADEIRQFRRHLCEKYGLNRGAEEGDVYCLALNFFPVTHSKGSPQ